MEQERAMSWAEAFVRTKTANRLGKMMRHRERGEGLAAQAVIIGVTAVIGTAILTAFMNGLGQVFTSLLNTIARIVPGGVTITGG
jgi:hypothetical protein